MQVSGHMHYMFSKRKKAHKKPRKLTTENKRAWCNLSINTYMIALALLFMKFTKSQNGHQKKKNIPLQETLTPFQTSLTVQ